MPLYAGIDGVRKEIKILYAGVEGTARQLTSFLAGVDGVRKELLNKPTTLYYWKKYNAIKNTVTDTDESQALYYYYYEDIGGDLGEEWERYLTEEEFYSWTNGEGEFGQDWTSSTSGEQLIFKGFKTTTTTTYSKGATHIECVYDTNPNTFPQDGYQDGYWYIKTTGICDACLGGGGNEGGGGTGGDDCEHSTQTKHYEDYNSPTYHRYWYVCDECGTATTARQTEEHSSTQVQVGTCSQCGQPIWSRRCPQCGYVFSETCSCGANATKID